MIRPPRRQRNANRWPLWGLRERLLHHQRQAIDGRLFFRAQCNALGKRNLGAIERIVTLKYAALPGRRPRDWHSTAKSLENSDRKRLQVSDFIQTPFGHGT